MTNNNELKSFLKEKTEILKSAKRFRSTAKKVLVSIEGAIEVQENWIKDTIESGKNFHLLNSAHDRLITLEDFHREVDIMIGRGQCHPTYEELVFDGWVD